MKPSPSRPASSLTPYVWGVVLVLVCGLARWYLGPSLGIRFPFITLFFAVFFSAWLGGFGPALFASILGVIFALIFFFPPIGSFPPFTTETTIGVVLFLVNGLAVGWLGESRLRSYRATRNALRLAEEQSKLAEESAAIAEEEAARTEYEAARVTSILEGIGDGFYSLDREWRLIYVNDTAAEAMRRPRSELIGKNLWELFPQAVGSVFQREFERAIRERKMVTLEDFSLLTGLWMSVRAYPTEDGLSVFFEDKTAHRQAVRALEESEERLRLATDVGKFGIWDWDMVHNRVTWSPRIYEFHGLTPEEFDGTVEAFQKLVYPADADAMAQAIQSAVETHGEFQAEFRTVRPNGEIRWLSTNGRVVYDEAGKPVRMLGATQDVTQQRDGEERLRQTQRIEAAGRIAGGVAHEVNNQMTVVLGLTEFMLRSPDLTPELRSDAIQIRRAGERSALITSQLLAFSRQQILWPTLIDLNRIVSEFERVLRKSAGEGITLVLRLSPDLPQVLADRSQMEQVLINLMLNAADAMGGGPGMLTIETSHRRFTPDYISKRSEVAIGPGEYVMLAVSDTGMGMSAEVMSHVFEPFFTTKPVGQGSGLGLSSVYGIVKQSSGYIWAYSEPGLGSTFKIYLPVPREVPVTQPPAPPAISLQGSETILVVEDEPDLRILVGRMLDELGYRSIVVSNGLEALEVLRTEGSKVNLLVTDVAMPAMSGRELGHQVAREFPGLPVLYMSGYTDRDIVARGLLEKDMPFIQKPFLPDDLALHVRQALDSYSRRSG